MTEKDIMEALECCSRQTNPFCDDCFYNESASKCGCIAEVMMDALDLINDKNAKLDQYAREIFGLKAEIERLRKYNLDMGHKHYNDGINDGILDLAAILKRRQEGSLILITTESLKRIVKERLYK